MDKFKMYRPLLSRIKGEYDLVLHQYSQQLHMLNATQFKVRVGAGQGVRGVQTYSS